MAEQKSPNSKCVSLAEVVSEYGLSNYSQLSMEHLKNICPAIIHQGLLLICPTEPSSPEALDPSGESLPKSVSFKTQFLDLMKHAMCIEQCW
ncbi:zinc transporter ZIP8-like [Arapaima gigas]